MSSRRIAVQISPSSSGTCPASRPKVFFQGVGVAPHVEPVEILADIDALALRDQTARQQGRFVLGFFGLL